MSEVKHWRNKQARKQAETDKNHYLQREAMIEAGIGTEIMINKPKGGFKDLAEKNLYEVNQGLKIQAMRLMYQNQKKGKDEVDDYGKEMMR